MIRLAAHRCLRRLAMFDLCDVARHRVLRGEREFLTVVREIDLRTGQQAVCLLYTSDAADE